MNKTLYKIAATACLKVYDQNIELSLGTEYFHSLVMRDGKTYQLISIAGTDELIDMVKNVNLLSWEGIKLSAYRSAKRIMSDITLYPSIPVIVTGHSLGGAVAIAVQKMFKFDHCIAFAPARCLRYWTNRNMKNTTIFIDPDDIVPKLGFISFCHPKCKIIKSKDNHKLISIDDHKMNHWVDFVDNMKQ